MTRLTAAEIDLILPVLDREAERLIRKNRCGPLDQRVARAVGAIRKLTEQRETAE